jgi:putative membrane protein
MLLKSKLSLYRVIKITWKIDLLMLALCSVAYFIDTYLFAEIHIPPALPTLIGTAIAFFIGFNNNQAYSRWWEARIIWGGIVNDSRTWTRDLLAYTMDGAGTKKMIYRHIAFLYALKASLRRQDDDYYKQYMSPEDIAQVEGKANIPNAILILQAHDVQRLSDEGKIDGFRFRAVNEMLTNFCDGMGKSERINNTVFPTPYVYFTRLFIWLLVVLTTMTLSELINGWAIFFGWLIGFVFHTTHINGMNLMNPFEIAPSCIPLNSITRTIEINLLQSMNETNIPLPEQAIHDGEYIL